MPVGVNLKTFVCSSTGEGARNQDYRKPVLHSTILVVPLTQPSTWSSWELGPECACSEALTTLVCQPCASLANASANTYRRIKAYSTSLASLGRGQQESQACLECPNALWISVFIGNSLRFLWGLAAESLSVLSDSKVLPTDVGNAVAEVGEIVQSMCRAGLGCSTSPKHEIKLIIVRSPSSVMSGGRTW